MRRISSDSGSRDTSRRPDGFAHMRNVFFTLFAIGLAGIAAMAATTAVLNAPVRPAYIGPPPKSEQPAAPEANPPATSEPAPASEPGAPPASPAPPDSSLPSPAAGSSAPVDGAAVDDEPDEDPYGDIAEEELPPDLQYDADSSVSFPTNI